MNSKEQNKFHQKPDFKFLIYCRNNEGKVVLISCLAIHLQN